MVHISEINMDQGKAIPLQFWGGCVVVCVSTKSWPDSTAVQTCDYQLESELGQINCWSWWLGGVGPRAGFTTLVAKLDDTGTGAFGREQPPPIKRLCLQTIICSPIDPKVQGWVGQPGLIVRGH